MNFILHRVNTIEKLRDCDPSYGVEVDIRSQGDALVIHHDPFANGVSFEDWLAYYRHRTLILNVKEEGLEERLVRLMLEHQIEDYFFLDQSFPFMIRWAEAVNGRCAVRISEFESIQTALCVADLVNWAWIDCFTRFPINKIEAAQLQKAGLRLCIVSPELHGRDETKISTMADQLTEHGVGFDAVCTKRPEVWRQVLDCR